MFNFTGNADKTLTYFIRIKILLQLLLILAEYSFSGSSAPGLIVLTIISFFFLYHLSKLKNWARRLWILWGMTSLGVIGYMIFGPGAYTTISTNNGHALLSEFLITMHEVVKLMLAIFLVEPVAKQLFPESKTDPDPIVFWVIFLSIQILFFCCSLTYRREFKISEGIPLQDPGASSPAQVPFQIGYESRIMEDGSLSSKATLGENRWIILSSEVKPLPSGGYTCSYSVANGTDTLMDEWTLHFNVGASFRKRVERDKFAIVESPEGWQSTVSPEYEIVGWKANSVINRIHSGHALSGFRMYSPGPPTRAIVEMSILRSGPGLSNFKIEAFIPTSSGS